MKKTILIISLIFVAICSNAQHKIQTPHPDLDVKLKRAVEANGILVIDLLITNYGSRDENITFEGSSMYYTTSIAFDDEGNQYKGGSSISYSVGGEEVYHGTTNVVLSPEVPVKFRVQIEKVDPYAKAITQLKICCYSRGSMGLERERPIVIKNLEFTKR